MLNTTDLGPDHVPRECASVKSWSGGDLYVKAWPGTIVPVDYTLSIQVTPANTPARATRRITKKVCQYLFYTLDTLILASKKFHTCEFIK